MMNMKKMLSLILALMLSLSLCACGGGDPAAEETTEEETTAQEAEPTETGEAEEPEDSDGLAAGDEGDGPADLQVGLFSVTIPEGISYEVYDYFVDNNGEGKPQTGNVTLYLYIDGMLSGSLIATTRNMVSSMDEAVENTIKLCNLDTYENGTYTMGDTATFGDLTYQGLSTSTNYGTDHYYVTYVVRGEDDKDGLKVELKTDEARIAPDDQRVIDLLNSLSVVVAE